MIIETTKGKVVLQAFRRTMLLTTWKKMKSSDPVFLCGHERTVPWDCGCSSGCDCCRLRFKCEDCGSLLADANIPSAFNYNPSQDGQYQ